MKMNSFLFCLILACDVNSINYKCSILIILFNEIFSRMANLNNVYAINYVLNNAMVCFF
jgi:hypothetical protein